MSSKKTIKEFLVHIGLILATFIFISYLLFYVWLPNMTHHGQTIEVPDFKGKLFSEAIALIKDKEFRYVIFDSVYTPGQETMKVLKHFPNPGERVKINRTIYFTVSMVNPPLIHMPKLVSNSLKAAEMTLQSHGLQLGQISYAPNANEGSVLKQMAEGQSIAPGEPIKKGTVIDLLVSSGLGSEDVIVPNLVGLSLEEAKNLLSRQGLEAGSVIYNPDPEAQQGTVIRQKPENPSNDENIHVKTGEVIDLWVAGEELNQ